LSGIKRMEKSVSRKYIKVWLANLQRMQFTVNVNSR
jgi:hypothetical protein